MPKVNKNKKIKNKNDNDNKEELKFSGDMAYYTTNNKFDKSLNRFALLHKRNKLVRNGMDLHAIKLLKNKDVNPKDIEELKEIFGEETTKKLMDLSSCLNNNTLKNLY